MQNALSRVERAFYFLKEKQKNEQYFYDFTQPDVHIGICV